MWFRRFSAFCIALLACCSLCTASFAVEEAEDSESLEEAPIDSPSDVAEPPPEVTEPPELDVSAPVVAPEPPVPDAEIGEGAGLGSLDFSGPIPVIVLPAPEPEPSEDELLPDEDVLTPDDFSEDVIDLEPAASEPVPVIVIDEDPVYSVAPYAGSSSGVVIGDEPPANPLLYGSGWVTGVDSRLGRVTVYLPITYKSGYLGIDRSGYLYNVSSSSLSGYLAGVYNNSVTASGFSYPRYRVPSGSSYTYYDLRLIPENSNMDIAVDLVPRYTADDFFPYIIILFLGGCILCFMKRS